ncbi:ESCRT-0 subunit protein hse1 [Boothiomyces sp. JEL0866]|nr:ESCRT-0 subunit protein hse1 [Boothiomyces sp. JEL0866]
MESLIDTATSETNTGEDWGVIIKICEIVEGNPSKARDAVNIIIRKLNHRNVNVVLFSLTLSNALVQNCGLQLKQEICSRPYLQALLKLLNNNTTHITVRNRILDFVQTWAKDFKGNPSLDYMQEVYNQLRNEGYSFPSDQPPSPKKKSYVDKQKEEEELQLALALSLSQQQPAKQEQKSIPKALFSVKVLYDYHPTEDGELQLVKGSVVEVFDNSTFNDWWKGSYKGNVGIFPANYVEKITASTGEMDQGQLLLGKLGLIQNLKHNIAKADPLGHNYSENQRLQEEYQNILDLVPEVIKCAGNQRKKQDELAAIHERFTNACNTYQKLINAHGNAQRQMRKFQVNVEPSYFPPYQVQPTMDPQYQPQLAPRGIGYPQDFQQPVNPPPHQQYPPYIPQPPY